MGSTGRRTLAGVFALAIALTVLITTASTAADRYGVRSPRRSNLFGSVANGTFRGDSRQSRMRTVSMSQRDEGMAVATDSDQEAPEPEGLEEVYPQLGDEFDMSCGDCGPCAPPFWAHRTSVYVDALYLRAANVDLVYAVEMTGPDPALDSPTGPTGRLGPQFEAGTRGGISVALSECSSVFASYTWFESTVEDTIDANNGTVLASTVTHPSVANAAATSVQSAGRYEIDFQLVDAGYRHAFYGSCNSVLNYTLGARYGNLDQQLQTEQVIGVSTGLTTVTTDISFDGAGILFGLDGERMSSCTGLLIYGKAGASFLAGEFHGRFRQSNQFGGAAVIASDIVDYRLVSLLEAELGVGWQNACGNLRLTAGFLVSGWFNTLTTSEDIRGAHESSFDQLDETLVFTGLTSRLEWRF